MNSLTKPIGRYALLTGLKALDLKFRVTKKVPPLLPRHAKDRISLSKTTKDFDPLTLILFYDECVIY